jgi:small subunit ribosomal protein S1
MSQTAHAYSNIEVEDFATLFEESQTVGGKSEGSVVKGIIVAIEKDVVIIDVGMKSEGRIPLREFSIGNTPAELKAGDEVEVYLEKIENKNGEAILSREKALREEAWVKLEKACANSERVDGVIFGRVKGGFTVDIQGAVAFLPGSQVDIRPIRDVTPLMHISQPFQILKMDRKRGNIVVSRRAILEESRVEARNDLLGKIVEGQVLDGIVKNITDYGAFIDMGGIDGLLHVTDISWRRISHPTEILSIGQTIKVMVTKFDQGTKRVSLGMKQLESNPWQEAAEKYSVGTKLSGKITNITDYGGIEGLVHVSEISWVKKSSHPSKLVSVSQEVNVVVLDIDVSKHRISLGMKQCEENPWAVYADKVKVGDVIEGEIRNITDFGLFVGLEGDIDGLVHHSDLSWTESGDAAIKNYKKGEVIKAKILAIDIEKERISLGVKQLNEAPANAIQEKSGDSSSDIQKGSTITCTVSEIHDDGITVKINDTVNSFIKKGDIARERQDQRPDRFAVGDRVDVKVVSVDKSGSKVGVSIKALEMDDHKKAISEYGSENSGASLGDILGAALSAASEGKKSKK